jgi:hypothetical protein
MHPKGVFIALYRRLWREPRDAKGPVRTTALWLMFACACYLLFRAARPGHSLASTFGTAVGTFLAYAVIICFAAGVVVRVARSTRGAISDDRDARGRPRTTGRAWSDEVPRQPRRMRDDDPELPLGRKR